METGIRPSSTSMDLMSMITSEGFTSRGQRNVHVLQAVQYHGRLSSMADANCFLRTSTLMLKGVFPDFGHTQGNRGLQVGPGKLAVL
jgi:hypothetical protein